ncbi:ribonuclease T2-like protein [Trichophaea hybrida]|nr:ribonuclease T2-like protein [Trichophaea hybrida]
MHLLLLLLGTLSLVSAYCSPKDLNPFLPQYHRTHLHLLRRLPSLGPEQPWTIHGLWPDFCDGTYPAYCDAACEYPSPVAVLESAGKHKLLRYMRKYWETNIRDGVDDEAFWKHEFDKHGTCMSTLEPKCYGNGYREGMEEWLKKCGIVPSEAETYSRAEVVECLQEAFMVTPFVGCDGEGRLNELWYYHWLRGKVLGGQYEETETTRESSCPESGIRYLPK